MDLSLGKHNDKERKLTTIVISVLLSVLLILSVVSLSIAEPLYVIKASSGALTFTTRKPTGARQYSIFRPAVPRFSRIIYRAALNTSGSGMRSFSRVRSPVKSSYDELIRQTAHAHQVEPALVKAVIHAESSFNPYARSRKGAMGLMQLMPATARRFGIQNAYHPGDNIQGGVRYLSMLINRYDGNLRLALAAYNAGEYIVDDLGEIPPYRETQNYVKRVLSLFKAYKNVDATG